METPQKNREAVGHVMVLTTILIYSFNTNFMKILMPEWIGPHGLVLVRCAIMAFGFWIVSFFIPVSKQQAKPGRKDVLMMMLGGLLGIGGNLLLYINGLNITGPVDAFVIRTVQPIIVIGLAVLILHAEFNRYKAIGIILGLAGTLYVSITPHAGIVKDSFTGDVLILVSSVLTALYLILIKPYTQKFNSVIVMRWMSLAGFILVLPFGLHQVLHAPPIHDGSTRTHLVGTGVRARFCHDDSLFLKLKSPAIYLPLRGKRVYLPPSCHRSHRVHLPRSSEIFMA